MNRVGAAIVAVACLRLAPLGTARAPAPTRFTRVPARRRAQARRQVPARRARRVVAGAGATGSAGSRRGGGTCGSRRRHRRHRCHRSRGRDGSAGRGRAEQRLQRRARDARAVHLAGRPARLDDDAPAQHPGRGQPRDPRQARVRPAGGGAGAGPTARSWLATTPTRSRCSGSRRTRSTRSRCG